MKWLRVNKEMSNLSFVPNFKITGRTVLFAALFLLAFLGRTAFQIAPNVEFVTAGMVLTAYYLGRRQSLWFVISVMVLSDLVLGNTSIFLFTWTGFLIPAFFLSISIRKLITFGHFKFLKSLPSITASGLFSTVFFFLWTNLGVWILDSWGMYPHTVSGLVSCYVNALPFLRNQITGTAFALPLLFIVIETAKSLAGKFSAAKHLIKSSV